MAGTHGFFIIVSLVRRLLRINTNIELILLPREMFRKKNNTIRVKVGKPIPFQKFDKSFSHWDWADKVRGYVYDMVHNSANNIYF